MSGEAKEIFTEELANIHDKFAAEIRNHFSAGEPTKHSAMTIALQYLNSGMLRAIMVERRDYQKAVGALRVIAECNHADGNKLSDHAFLTLKELGEL